ncbi:hypothetical protein L1049_011777 [Liquidambar formosana]|uniref:Bifunctional inhibitor/plant lipid transfer protein/seed storage helical domain-containing protein n=1 Tax=Liquidambar formosana TaxID=63359 RepID=A0AAP0RS36_LIQFO
MAVFGIRFLVLSIFVSAGIFISGDSVVTGLTCRVDVEDLIAECSQYVGNAGPKVAPSQGCCEAIETVDVPCACKYVTREVERIVSMEKVVYVSEFCGIALQHGMKCGSKRNQSL